MTDAAAPVAVVTGAGSGIGQAVAHALLAQGYRVALAGRRVEHLSQTAADHPQALVVPTDVTDPVAVQALFDQVVATWGRVDVLFNNAGITGTMASVDDVDVEDWRGVLDVNLTGVMLCAQAAFRVMKSQQPQGGRIINNGSLSAHTPRPASTSYTATKHAVSGLTKSIDLDGRPYGITCGQIDIGNAATALVSALSSGDGTPGALQPGGTRLVEPQFPVEEVGRAVVFMASLPPSTTVSSMVILASGMPFVGRG